MARKTAGTQKTFTVTARVGADVQIEVTADSLENALLRAKELKFENFLSYVGEYQDNEFIELRSLWDNAE